MTSSPDRWLRVKELLADALELSAPARAGFLDTACGDDAELRAEVDALLASADDATAFLDTPALESASFEPIGSTLNPGDRIGVYRIVEEIGEGGFSLVYGATQEQPIRRRVAIKLIKPGMDSRQIAQRFAAERETLARMDHPNIARVLDAGTTEHGRPFVVMEWVDGQTFSDYCDTRSLSIDARLSLFLQVCRAVEHAHQKGVVHRDLKPSNVLVEEREGTPVVKVIDFGIAKALTPTDPDASLLTQTGLMLGTPEYMSPEQAGLAGVDVDTRTDVYALGVLLYETLTGVRPFAKATLQGAALDEVFRIIREEDPPRPSTRVERATRTEPATTVAAERRQLRPGDLSRTLRGDLDWIVMKALEKDRDQRYASVTGFAEDLQRHLRHEPVTAGPPLLRYRLQKFARRNRALFVGLSVAGLAVVAGGVLAGIGFYQASNQRDLAQRAATEERAARQDAEQALREAEAVGTFLADLLRSVRPAEKGKDVKVRALLDDADLSLLDNALVEARLRDVIGNSYRSLGVLDRAAAQLTKGVEIARRELGPDDSRTIKLEFNLLLVRLDRTDEEGLLEAVESLLARAERALGASDELTLGLRSTRGSVLLARRRFEEAQKVLLGVLPDHERVLGEDDRGTLSLYANLSLVLSYRRDFAGAEKYARIGRERSLRVYGEEDPRTLLAGRALAVALFRQRRWDDALEVLRPLHATMVRVLGEDHFDSLGVANYIGYVLQSSGKLAAAEKLYATLVPLQDRVLGDGHRQSMMGAHNYGMLLLSQQRFAAARQQLRDVLDRYEEHRGAGHFETEVARFHLGQALSDEGDRKASLPHLETAVAALVGSSGWKHPQVIEAATLLVQNLQQLAQDQERGGNATAAIELLLRAWDPAEHLDGFAEKPALAMALHRLYASQGDAEAAALWKSRADR